MNKRILELPDHFENAISQELESLGYPLSGSRRLADVVLRLSDFYTQQTQAATPWHEPWARAAQLSYYFPLNYARNAAVALEAKRLGFFDGINSIIDFGSGAGSALFAFAEQMQTEQMQVQAELQSPGKISATAIDVSEEALSLGVSLKPKNWPGHDRKVARDLRPIHKVKAKETLLVASFVFTELNTLPPEWLEYEALAIIEPSTQVDSRRLMSERQDLINHGFQIWAPCTHTLSCPLLEHSAKDWCHDRIHWQAPKWMLEIEKFLPIKNRTLTYSYLLARKSLPTPKNLSRHGRLTGDMLIEKGKTRQSVCRSSEREFLSWFPQRLSKGESIDLQRGSLVRIDPNSEVKSNEVRLKNPKSIYELPAQESISAEDANHLT